MKDEYQNSKFEGVLFIKYLTIQMEGGGKVYSYSWSFYFFRNDILMRWKFNRYKGEVKNMLSSGEK